MRQEKMRQGLIRVLERQELGAKLAAEFAAALAEGRAEEATEVTDRGEGPSGAVGGMLVILFVGLVCGYVIGLLTGQAMVEFLR